MCNFATLSLFTHILSVHSAYSSLNDTTLVLLHLLFITCLYVSSDRLCCVNFRRIERGVMSIIGQY